VMIATVLALAAVVLFGGEPRPAPASELAHVETVAGPE